MTSKTTTYRLTIGQLSSGGHSAERVLALVEDADPGALVEVEDETSGASCEITADLDDECLTLRCGDEIRAIGDEVSADTIERFLT